MIAISFCVTIIVHMLQTFVLRKRCPYSESFWSKFSALGLGMEIYSVNLCIQSESGKMTIRKTPNMGTFYAVMIINSFKHDVEKRPNILWKILWFN